jgi:hypothetical protein
MWLNAPVHNNCPSAPLLALLLESSVRRFRLLQQYRATLPRFPMLPSCRLLLVHCQLQPTQHFYLPIRLPSTIWSLPLTFRTSTSLLILPRLVYLCTPIMVAVVLPSKPVPHVLMRGECAILCRLRGRLIPPLLLVLHSRKRALGAMAR